MANNNKKVIDLPFFELCSQAPTATSTSSLSPNALCTSEDGSNRYIYYMVGSTFYRYDTNADTWQRLANPITAPANSVLSMRYTSMRGYHGRVISATSTSVTIPGLRGGVFDGKTIRILSGTGAGQDRTLTYTGETVHDEGIVNSVYTGSISSSGVTDTTKRWKTNQWAGYIVGITYGTNATQYKKIIYNDSTTLHVADLNLRAQDPWNNQPYSSTTPYSVPIANNSNYQIMSSTYNVSAWTVTPDYTSYFTTLTGGIFLLSSTTTTFSLQYYDVIHDSWQVKSTPASSGLINNTPGTDITCERIARVGTAYTTNIGTISGGNRTLTDSTQALTNDRYANYRILITGGTGIGQSRRIVGHTTNTYTVERPWETNPDNTSTYQIWGDYDKLYVGGNGNSALFAYSPEFDYWMQGQNFDSGVCANISAKMNGWTPVAVSSGAIIANGVRAINTTPTAGGTGYAIGDVSVCNVGGTGAQVRVTSIAPGGIVTGIELIHSGTATGFTVGTGRATTTTGGVGSGTGLTIEITSVGETALITTASTHWFKAGDSITFAGATNASWNTSYTILGVPYFAATPPTTFCVISNVGANMSASSSQGTTTIVDASKNWTVNEHVGRLVHLSAQANSSGQSTAQVRWITANTATTLTVASITAGTNGTSKYAIYDAKVFGVDDQRKSADKKGYGYATSGTTTSLTDSTKNWIPNQWANYVFKVEAGTGYGSGRITITSNTETTLNFTTQSFTPDTTTKYEIVDTWGLLTTGGTAATLNITDTTKNWTTNIWSAKRVRYTAGNNFAVEDSVSSNTSTTITTSSAATTDTTTAYAILGIPTRSTGIELIHNFGSTDSAKKGRYMFFPRGGASSQIDIYDIPTGKWLFGYFNSPQAELFSTGSSYSYDGSNKIYCSRSISSDVLRIYVYDIDKNTLDGGMTSTVLQSSLHVGNLMEIVKDPTGEFAYLYYLQNSGTLMCRALIF